MMDDYNYGNGNDSDGNVTGVSLRTGSGQRQWPTSSADIVEYDSSVAADTPAVQPQQTQFLLPQQQQQRQRTNNKFSQRSGADVTANSNANYAGKSSIMSAVTADDSANRNSKFKWKKRALYVFLACLLTVVVINLTLTLWFIRVTQFTSVIT